jgi:hypothetical protein
MTAKQQVQWYYSVLQCCENCCGSMHDACNDEQQPVAAYRPATEHMVQQVPQQNRTLSERVVLVSIAGITNIQLDTSDMPHPHA